MSWQTIHHEVNRNLKHASAIAGFMVAAASFIPYTVTSQDCAHIGEQFKKHGMRYGTNFTSVKRYGRVRIVR
jgi:hypothetical protein